MRHFGEFMAKKARLGVDSWGSTDRELPEVMEPLHALIAREFPAWSPYPWNARSTTDDLVRHILFAQAMLPEYAACFRGLDDDGAGRAGGLVPLGRVRAPRPAVRDRASAAYAMS